MATPRFVKFSRVLGTPEDVLTRLELRLLGSMRLEYDRFAALKPVEDPDDFGYTGGLDLAGEMVPCRGKSEALSLARKWTAWGISFLVREIPAYVNLYIFDIQEGSLGVALSFDTSMLSYETDESPEGQWLRALFISLVAALGCAVCGYGPDNAYRTGYVPLSPAKILERLRAGELFKMSYPNFHAISVSLLTTEEMTALWERLPRSEFLKYGLATTGYHILSIIP